MESSSSNNIISRSLQDGGSSAGLTQGEIIFVALACFVVVIAAIFAIYTVFMKRRRPEADVKTSARQNTTTYSPAENSPVNSSEKGISSNLDQYPAPDAGNSMSHESSWRNNRRCSTDSDRNRRRGSMNTVDSTGSSDGKKSRRSSMGSGGSNVSNQYKVAAINQMRRMSELSEP
jgi:hypothetical protein